MVRLVERPWNRIQVFLRAVSCVAMSIIDLMYHAFLAAQSIPTSWPVSYVDNWEALVSDVHLVLVVHLAIRQFANALDICIDAATSYSWATQDADRHTLRGQGLVVVNAGRDLGAHMQYTKQHGNATLHIRVAQLQDVWTKLRQSFGDYRAKRHAIKAVAWKRALYGASISTLSPEMLQKMRTGVMSSLRVKKAGASPWAHLTFCEHLQASVRDMRPLANREQVTEILERWLSEGGNLPPGPLSVLIKRCHRIGLSVGPELVIHDQIGQFSLLEVSIQEVQLCFRRAWSRHAGGMLSARWDFTGALTGDPVETRKVCPAADMAEVAVWRTVVNGTTYAQDTRAKISPAESAACPWCARPDSVWHRLWECAFFERDRSVMSDNTSALTESLPKCLAMHGIVPEVAGKQQLLAFLQGTHDSTGCLEPVSVVGEQGRLALGQQLFKLLHLHVEHGLHLDALLLHGCMDATDLHLLGHSLLLHLQVPGAGAQSDPSATCRRHQFIIRVT